MNIKGIGQINIRTHDVDRAVAFYRDALGLRFLFRGGPNLAFFDCGGVRILLDKPEGAEFDHASSIIYFSVDDIRASFAALRQRNVKMMSEPHMIARLEDREVWMAFFRDSEDNVHALMSEVPR